MNWSCLVEFFKFQELLLPKGSNGSNSTSSCDEDEWNIARWTCQFVSKGQLCMKLHKTLFFTYQSLLAWKKLFLKWECHRGCQKSVTYLMNDPFLGYELIFRRFQKDKNIFGLNVTFLFNSLHIPFYNYNLLSDIF